jgi:lysine 2-monooxygenase
MVKERGRDAARGGKRLVTVFGPDFPFPFDDWISHPAGLDSIPAGHHGEEVAVVGAGISGLVAAYELMRLRADEARPQAGGLRGLADGRAVAFAGV